MLKKVLCFVLSAFIVLGIIVVAKASTFVDVPDDAYYADAAERMADRNILSGYGDGYYYGNQSITRAQVAALVCKMLGKADDAAALAGKTAFADIPETNWSTGYVNYAVANGIINGDGDGNFRPDDSVKYEEVVKVIVCVLGLDKDVKIDPADWSKEYIEAADKAGLLKNLIGKKGDAMLRSDIAVICDAAMVILDEKEAEDSTASTQEDKPSIKPADSGKETDVTTEVKHAETTEKSETTTTARKPAETLEQPEERGEDEGPTV